MAPKLLIYFVGITENVFYTSLQFVLDDSHRRCHIGKITFSQEMFLMVHLSTFLSFIIYNIQRLTMSRANTIIILLVAVCFLKCVINTIIVSSTYFQLLLFCAPAFGSEPVPKSKQINYQPLPEIKHQFRQQEPRPPQIVSDVFSLLCAAPILLLFVLVSVYEWYISENAKKPMDNLVEQFQNFMIAFLRFKYYVFDSIFCKFLLTANCDENDTKRLFVI